VHAARANAARLGIDVRFVEGDLLAGVDADVVVANLPYVASGDQLAPDIALYEPPGALLAGADGLDVIRRLVPALPARVSDVALELDPAQVPTVGALLAGAGFPSVAVLRDLAGHERVVVGRR
jgi:release factor glutamine methyltransferase